MLVLAKVRPNNNYGGSAPEGTVLEVEEAEVDRVPWCLERIADPLTDVAPGLALADDAPASSDSPDAPAAPAKRKK